MQGCGGGTIGGSDSETGGIVNQSPNLDEVEEDSRINWPRSRRVVVAVCETLEDFWRQIQPRAMVGRNMSPMPGSRVSMGEIFTSNSEWERVDRVIYLLRHITKVGGTVSSCAGLPLANCCADGIGPVVGFSPGTIGEEESPSATLLVDCVEALGFFFVMIWSLTWPGSDQIEDWRRCPQAVTVNGLQKQKMSVNASCTTICGPQGALSRWNLSELKIPISPIGSRQFQLKHKAVPVLFLFSIKRSEGSGREVRTCVTIIPRF